MRPDVLPRVGVIANTTHDVLRLFGAYLTVAKARVLCVGYNEGELASLVDPYGPAEVVCLTHWDDHPDARVSGRRMVVGDLCARTPFADGEFDTVLLLSVLEHLHDPAAAFAELRRLVRPHGHVALMFGPAWSSAYGHHLYADPGDPNLHFTSWALPAHMHLLCDRDEIRDWYRRQGYDDAVATTVLGWFFDTTIINRIFYEDLLRVMTADFQLVASEIMYNDLPRGHVEALRARFPPYMDFGTYGGKFLLRAGASP
jgi:SAM-dependent methyltransferase